MKSELEKIEKEGIYLFHGSPFKLDKLEPRQAYTYDGKKRKMIEDGEPAVIATPFLDIAIFRAVINKHNTPKNYWSEFSVEKSKLTLRTTKGVLEQAKKVKGYIHVLNKEDFEKYNSMEWRTKDSVSPVKVIEVGFNDLSEVEEISILEPKDYADIKYDIPYVLRFNKGEQFFVYFGIEHSNDPKRDQLKELEVEYTRWLENAGVNRIVVTEFTAPEEGGERDKLIKEYGEAGLMKYLSDKDGIEIMSVEPSPDKLTDYLVNDGRYEREDLVLWIIANSIFHTKDVDGVIGSIDKLNEKFEADKDSEYYKSRFLEITGDSLDIESAKKAQDPFSDKTLLNQIGSYINSVKDILVAERLLKLLDSGKSIFAVYGHNHVFAQEAMLEVCFK